MNSLRDLFSCFCSQQNNWILAGQPLPFCQRCTGLYVGASCALLLILLFRPRPSAFLYWIHGIFMLVMFPFGFHLVAHGPATKTLSGALFAFGLVYYLALNPLTARQAWKSATVSSLSAYFALIAIAIAALLWSVHAESTIALILLTAFGTAGLAALTFLTIANFILLPSLVRAARVPSRSSLP